MKISKILLLLCACYLVIVPHDTQAGGCYMPQEAIQGTVATKQAVYIRSMPCMEEGYVVVTSSSREVLDVSLVSDGWYQVHRKDGTKGWIYYTWLQDIAVSPLDTMGTMQKPTPIYTKDSIDKTDKYHDMQQKKEKEKEYNKEKDMQMREKALAEKRMKSADKNIGVLPQSIKDTLSKNVGLLKNRCETNADVNCLMQYKSIIASLQRVSSKNPKLLPITQFISDLLLE